MYKKIIVGLSLEHGIADRALRTARALGGDGAEILAVHVAEPLQGSVRFHIREEDMQKARAQMEADLQERLADHPDLAEVGGMVELGSDLTGYDHPIFLRNDGNDEFTALGAYCNHEGCSVQPSSSGFRCPCHGATFDADGMLRGGPATADLVSFDTTSDGTTVTILAG